MALGWCDPNIIVRNKHLPIEHLANAVGPLLREHADTRGFFPQDKKAAKNANAARWLVSGALELLRQAIPIVRKIGNDYKADKIADSFEDKLEIISESPCSSPSIPKIAESQIQHLKSRAFFRISSGLCGTVANIFFAGKYENKKEIEERNKWFELDSTFQKRAAEAYVFAVKMAGFKNEEEISLLKAMDDAQSYSPSFSNRHYRPIEAARECGSIVTALINILQMALLGNYDWNIESPETLSKIFFLSKLPNAIFPSLLS